MSVSTAEFRENLSKYLALSETEDVFITKKGKIIAKLTNPYKNRGNIAQSLFGIIPEDVDLEKEKEERLSR